jgi:cell fate regulator YaaT (PSP1 superfamily)
MENALSRAADQVPTLVVFVVFIIIIYRIQSASTEEAQKRHSESVAANHSRWEERLKRIFEDIHRHDKERQEAMFNFVAQRDKILQEQREMDRQQWAETAVVLGRVQSELSQLSTLILMVYSAVKPAADTETIRKVLDKKERQ